MTLPAFRLGIDVGGTFTDFLLIDSNGNSKIYKTLSTPQDLIVGFFNGIREMAEDHGLNVPTFLNRVQLIVHGTTAGTNAALTYTGAKTALLTTKGFRDVLQMRQGIRPDPFNNRYEAPPAYVPRYLRIGIEERIDLNGQIVKPLNKEELREIINYLKSHNIESIAVSFMHAYANPAHEKEVGDVIKETLPECYLTLSSELIPKAGLYERTSTTVLNSYVGPIIRRYLTRLTAKLKEHNFRGTLLIMQSNGGVTSPQIAMEQAANTLLSGPASAPVAGGWYLKAHQHDQAITMDMGGTSFDVSIVQDGEAVLRREGEIAEWPIHLPTVDIHTIGAGGGSIAWVDDGGLLHVGPQSAGANPGPACYGFGGERPTITDANLILGYLNPDYFLGGKMRLYPEKAEQAIKTYVADPLGISVEEAAKGIIHLANVQMANGIRHITIKRGHDPREFPLVCAGGAGPLHAAAIAKELGITKIFIPRESSIFCAAGMMMTDLRHDYVKTYRALSREMDEEKFKALFEELKQQGIETLNKEGVATENISFRYSVDMKYAGQYFEVTVPLSPELMNHFSIDRLEEEFHKRHELLYGYSTPGMPTEMINFNLSAHGHTTKPTAKEAEYMGESPERAYKGVRLAYQSDKDQLVETPVYDGHLLAHGNIIYGPAIIEQAVTTIIVDGDFNLVCDKNDNFIMLHKDLGKEAAERYIKKYGGVVYEERNY